jgi:hypothetical protein
LQYTTHVILESLREFKAIDIDDSIPLLVHIFLRGINKEKHLKDKNGYVETIAAYNHALTYKGLIIISQYVSMEGLPVLVNDIISKLHSSIDTVVIKRVILKLILVSKNISINNCWVKKKYFDERKRNFTIHL